MSDTDDQAKPPKKSWIYGLRGEALKEELQKYGLPSEGTVDEMRKRLVKLTEQARDIICGETKQDPQLTKPEDNSKPANEATTRSPCETVRKWNVSFDGKSDAVMFLERLEEARTGYDIPNNQLLTAIPELLRGSAILWYRNNRENWITWDDFVKSFRGFYLPTDYQLQLAEEISKRVQKTGERGRDYIVELQTLMRRHAGLSKEERLFRLYKNLQPEYRQYIRRKDFNNVDDLLRQVEEYESLQKEIRPNTARLATVHTVTTPKPQFNQATCWRCGQRGHVRKHCRNPRVLFCSRCRKPGVLSMNCPCPGNPNRAGT